MNVFSRAAQRAALVLAFASSLASAQAAEARVYVQFAPGQKAAATAALGQQGARTHHEFDDLNLVAVTIPAQAQAGLSRNPNIISIEEDPQRQLFAQTVPYGISMVQADTVVAGGTTGAGIKVGVIDSGVFHVHQDLSAVPITGEPDFGAADQRTWSRDMNSHGTHVVGTIAAANNSLGVVGVSPGVSVHMVKVFGDTGGWVYSSDVVAAARMAVAKGARVINMSLGGSRKSKAEQSGMDDLYNSKRALLVAAAGNDGNTATSYPAGYASVISVGAIDSTGAVASFSQQNSDVELAAPGVSVLSTVSYVDSTFVAVDGSNYAARHVEFSARGTASAPLVYGGLGTSGNPAWAGKVVLLDRGTNTFLEKVQNVQSSGGVACIIANNVPGDLLATLGDGNSSTIPAVSVSQADGTALQTKTGLSTTVSSTVTQPDHGYATNDGTSMATPHVAGVAALIWSQYRGATNAQVRQALTSSAQDLGAAGRDVAYGFGLVRASAALAALGALSPAPANPDSTAPTISNVVATVTNSRNGTFQVSWQTNEPATSDVQVNTTISANATLSTTHTRSLRGTRGATYYLYVISADAAGNVASAGPFSVTL